MAMERKVTDSEDDSEEYSHATEDEIDTAIARKRIARIESDPEELVRGEGLAESLAETIYVWTFSQKQRFHLKSSLTMSFRTQ